MFHAYVSKKASSMIVQLKKKKGKMTQTVFTEHHLVTSNLTDR